MNWRRASDAMGRGDRDRRELVTDVASFVDVIDDGLRRQLNR